MTTTPAPTEIDTLKALEQSANPAPWRAHHDEGHLSAVWFTPGSCLVDVEPSDAALIAAMRNALPALLDELAKTRRELDATRRAKAENDERFMLERDAAREELAKTRAELKRAHAESDMWMGQLEALTNAANAYQKRTEAELAEARQTIAARDAALDASTETHRIAQQIVLATLGASPATTAEPADVDTFIARSSLGTPDAVALRAATDDATAARIVARVAELGETEPADEPKAKRRCVAMGCDGTPPKFDLACDRHPACPECGGRYMHDITCRTARARRLAGVPAIPDAEPAAG